MKWGGRLLNLLYEINIRPDTKSRGRLHEKRRKLVSNITLMKMSGNFLNKILTNQIQQYIERIMHHDQVDSVPGIQAWPQYLQIDLHDISHK